MLKKHIDIAKHPFVETKKLRRAALLLCCFKELGVRGIYGLGMRTMADLCKMLRLNLVTNRMKKDNLSTQLSLDSIETHIIKLVLSMKAHHANKECPKDSLGPCYRPVSF